MSRTILQNGILNIENLEVHYGPIIALRGVTISVKSGQSVALLGSNGAGKSTLLKAVSGILLPSKGSIRFEGKSILGKDPSIIVSMGLAHVPEGREIFPLLTVKQNLLLGAYSRVDKRQVKRDFDLVIHYFPALQDLLKMEAKVLSGGQQQRTAIARAVAAKPLLILADEPTGNLDETNTISVIKMLNRLVSKHQTTLLVATHSQTLAASLKTQVVLKKGTLRKYVL